MRISRRERAAGEISQAGLSYHFLVGLLKCQKSWRNAKEKLKILR